MRDLDAPPTQDEPRSGSQRESAGLVSFADPVQTLVTVGIGVTGAGIAGCVVDGLVNGLTFALMAKWVGIILAVLVLAGLIVTLRHAYRRAREAERNNEPMADPGVGVLRPRRPQKDAE